MFERFYAIRAAVDVAAARPRFDVPREVARLGDAPNVSLGLFGVVFVAS